MLFVFIDVFKPWLCISSPDDAPFYFQNYQVVLLDAWFSGKTPFTPFGLVNFLPPIAFHEARYIVAMFLFGLSGVYYFRTLRIERLAAYGSGLLLAFSGYIFTLFCAGHMGFFFLMGIFFWSFGLLNRCIEQGKLRHFAMLGAVVMWAQPGQPDVWLLFALILACYALKRLWSVRPIFLKLLPKFLLTLLVAGLVGAGSVHTVFTQHLAGRDKQIAESTRPATDGPQTDINQKNSQERWDFATGWSLPPADCIELAIPGFFGNDSMRPPYPYWGALGRPHAFLPGRMMPNYRQHTIYLGLVSITLALFGVFAWLSFRKNRPSPTAALRPSTSDLRSLPSVYSDVPFWCVVWVICLILALGRYTPFYRLFYAIPYMDYLRAPVKFLHFTELATGLLAGFGLQALLASPFSDKAKKRMLIGSVGLIVLLVLIAWVVLVSGPRMEAHIRTLGLGQVAGVLHGYTSYNCLRAIGLALGLSALLYLWKAQQQNTARISLVVAGIVLVGVFDLAAVARRYVNPINLQAFHAENAVTREISQRTAKQVSHMANYVTRNVWLQDWLNTSFYVHGITPILPTEGDLTTKEYQIASAFQNNPLRHWDVMGVRFLLLQIQQAEPLIKQKAAVPVAMYDFGNGGVRKTATPSAQTIILLERQQSAFPCVYFNWTGDVAPDRQIDQLIQPGQALHVTDAASPVKPDDQPPQSVPFKQMRGAKSVFVSRAEVDLPRPGLLIWNERYSPDLVATLDGKEVPLHQANGIWCALQVPAGRHAVTCRTRFAGWMNMLSFGTSLLVVLACSLAVLAKPR